MKETISILATKTIQIGLVLLAFLIPIFFVFSPNFAWVLFMIVKELKVINSDITIIVSQFGISSKNSANMIGNKTKKSGGVNIILTP